MNALDDAQRDCLPVESKVYFFCTDASNVFRGTAATSRAEEQYTDSDRHDDTRELHSLGLFKTCLIRHDPERLPELGRTCEVPSGG